jgi:hypothetical protein
MNITHLPIPLDTSHTSLDRSPGIHLSGILSKMAVAQGIYSPSTSSSPDESRHFKRCLGLAWEDWLAARLPATYPTFEYHLGEICIDGIYMHPDGIHYEPDGSIILHEIKYTYYSTRQLLHPLEKLIVWFWQGMGYLYGLTKYTGQLCTSAIYHPAFACGDYKDGMNPVYRPFQCDFTWEEIEAFWQLVLANKYLAEAESYSRVVAVEGLQSIPVSGEKG